MFRFPQLFPKSSILISLPAIAWSAYPCVCAKSCPLAHSPLLGFIPVYPTARSYSSLQLNTHLDPSKSDLLIFPWMHVLPSNQLSWPNMWHLKLFLLALQHPISDHPINYIFFIFLKINVSLNLHCCCFSSYSHFTPGSPSTNSFSCTYYTTLPLQPLF